MTDKSKPGAARATRTPGKIAKANQPPQCTSLSPISQIGAGASKSTAREGGVMTAAGQIGAIVTRGGFRYKVLDRCQRETAYGAPYTLLTVAGQCTDCGVVFTYTITKSRFQKKNQLRRCKLHAQAGVPARPWHERAKR